jgi:predicted  nucleic acid-binding Zn-ribbon protein
MATLTRRVELIEEKMEGLADLPGRVTRVEERLTGVEVRLTKVENELGDLRVEMRGEFGRVWAEFDKVRQEIRSGDEETRNLMRILHEEVIERFKLLEEGIDRMNGGPRGGKQ